MRKFNPTAISAISAIPAVGAGICKNRAGRMPATPGGNMSELVDIAAAPYEQKLPCRRTARWR